MDGWVLLWMVRGFTSERCLDKTLIASVPHVQNIRKQDAKIEEILFVRRWRFVEDYICHPMFGQADIGKTNVRPSLPSPIFSFRTLILVPWEREAGRPQPAISPQTNANLLCKTPIKDGYVVAATNPSSRPTGWLPVILFLLHVVSSRDTWLIKWRTEWVMFLSIYYYISKCNLSPGTTGIIEYYEYRRTFTVSSLLESRLSRPPTTITST